MFTWALHLRSVISADTIQVPFLQVFLLIIKRRFSLVFCMRIHRCLFGITSKQSISSKAFLCINECTQRTVKAQGYGFKSVQYLLYCHCLTHFHHHFHSFSHLSRFHMKSRRESRLHMYVSPDITPAIISNFTFLFIATIPDKSLGIPCNLYMSGN